jgi:hypothetical protein
VLDIVFGVLNLVGSFVVAGNESNDAPYSDEPSDGALIAAGVVWAGISTVSAVIGFDRVKQCVAAKQALRERQAHASVAPAGGASSVGITPILAVLIMGGRDTLTVGEQTQLIAKAFDAAGAALPADRLRGRRRTCDRLRQQRRPRDDRATGSVVIAANCDNVVGTVHLVVLAQH